MAVPACGERGSADKRMLLPVREVAEMLGVSRSTVVRAYESGEFPVVKFRGTYRIPRRFVERLLTAAIPGHPVVVEEHAARWDPGDGPVA
jgi:excisionase family DNA binding protein